MNRKLKILTKFLRPKSFNDREKAAELRERADRVNRAGVLIYEMHRDGELSDADYALLSLTISHEVDAVASALRRPR